MLLGIKPQRLFLKKSTIKLNFNFLNSINFTFPNINMHKVNLIIDELQFYKYFI